MTQIIIKKTRKTGLNFVESLGDGVELEMVLIKGGTFTMGAPEDEEDSRDSQRPQHEVTVPTFFMGKYQVTQAQWKVVANLPEVERELKPEPSYFKGDNRPVEQVSWYDAVEFCARLSNHTKRKYSLPSEAEWEYACRGGTITPQRGSSVAPGGNPHDRADSPFHFGETITSELANYDASYTYGDGSEGEYREETTSVASFGVANVFGLYDMHGNVFEWCLDDWHDNYEGAPRDGRAWFEDNDHLSQKSGIAVLRGGSWNHDPDICRSAFRYRRHRRERGYIPGNIGFRLACGVGRTY